MWDQSRLHSFVYLGDYMASAMHSVASIVVVVFTARDTIIVLEDTQLHHITEWMLSNHMCSEASVSYSIEIELEVIQTNVSEKFISLNYSKTFALAKFTDKEH